MQCTLCNQHQGKYLEIDKLRPDWIRFEKTWIGASLLKIK